MYRLKALLLFACCATTDFVFAQQLPLFTQYRENMSIINPASINSDFWTDEYNVSFGTSYRAQWIGLQNPPTTAVVRGEYFTTNSGVNLLTGGYILHDQTGPTSQTGIYGRIGGILSQDMQYSGISFAINAGLVQYRIKATELRLRDANDVLTTENLNKLYPDVGLGVFAYQEIGGGGFFDDDYVYGGISVPQVFGLNLEFKDENGSFNTKRIQHIYAQAGLYHKLSEGFVEASTWLKYAPNAPFNADFNMRYQMPGNFWIGVGASTAGNLHAETGIIAGKDLGYDNNFKIGYGFDYSFSSFGPYAGTTHEINLTYAFGK